MRYFLRLLSLAPLVYGPIDILLLSLPADPALKLNHYFGFWALLLITFNLGIGILLGLARQIGPQTLNRLVAGLAKERRWLGVLAFIYLLIHLSFYFVNEALSFDALVQLVTKTYLQLALLGFVLLGILAFTSNNWSLKKLGGKRWKRLHRLVYVAMLLVAGHVLLIEKADLELFIPWFAVLAAVQIARYFFWLKRSRAKIST